MNDDAVWAGQDEVLCSLAAEATKTDDQDVHLLELADHLRAVLTLHSGEILSLHHQNKRENI